MHHRKSTLCTDDHTHVGRVNIGPSSEDLIVSIISTKVKVVSLKGPMPVVKFSHRALPRELRALLIVNVVASVLVGTQACGAGYYGSSSTATICTGCAAGTFRNMSNLNGFSPFFFVAQVYFQPVVRSPAVLVQMGSRVNLDPPTVLYALRAHTCSMLISAFYASLLRTRPQRSQ